MSTASRQSSLGSYEYDEPEVPEVGSTGAVAGSADRGALASEASRFVTLNFEQLLERLQRVVNGA